MKKWIKEHSNQLGHHTILGIGTLFAMALPLGAHWEVSRKEHLVRTSVKAGLEDLAILSEQVISARIKHIDNILLTLRELPRNNTHRLQEVLNLLRAGPLADNRLRIVVIDRDGYLSYTDAQGITPRTYLGDGDYFRYFSQGGSDRLFLDRPVLGRITKIYTLPLLRPLFDAEGKFDGLIGISIGARSLGDFGSSVKFLGDATVTLVNNRGQVVTRSHDRNGFHGENISPALLAKVTAADHGVFSEKEENSTLRQFAFRRVPETPLYLFASSKNHPLMLKFNTERNVVIFLGYFGSFLTVLMLILYKQRHRMSNKLIATQQAHLREAQRIANMGSWEYDLATKKVSCSENTLRMLSFPPHFSPTPADILAALPDTERRSITEEINSVIQSGSGAFEHIVIRADGELRNTVIRAETLRRSNGEVTGLVGTLQDVTEQRRIQKELQQHQTHLESLIAKRTADLNQALQEAKIAEIAKDTFLANMSHELRTPLSTIIGMTELANRANKDPNQEQYFNKITLAGEVLSGIISNILDLSKIAAGHMELDSSAFRPEKVLHDAFSIMSLSASQKGLEVVSEIDPAVPRVLVGDSLRIEQILLNLLSNAIKFSHAGKVEVRLSVTDKTPESVLLVMEVEDRGIGIADDQMQKLFQPFVQGDTSITRKFGGSGLGLALCKRLSESMGGDISAHSVLGQGTTVRVTLRLGIGQQSDLTTTSIPEIDPTTLRRTRVLVVEDNDTILELIESILESIGVKSTSVTNGKEAIDMLSRVGPGAFDLVLMDIQMPLMDGWSATRTIRMMKGFERVPIIALSAHSMAHEKQRCEEAGMNDHVCKPFDQQTLYRCLAKWVR